VKYYRLLLLIALVALPGCRTSDQPPAHSVSFKARSDGVGSAYVVYSVDDKHFTGPGTDTLPWETTVNVTALAIQESRFSVTVNSNATGTVTCEVWIDGALADQQTAPEEEVCAANTGTSSPSPRA
jgi:hypothetical protein